MKLYILGEQIELKEVEIAQTKQANDISSVETRQTNFTNSFTIPKTAKNIRTLQGLGLIGNDSSVPYQKNECFLFTDLGECLVYKGWAVFTEDYKCTIYDGNLELYKAIENKTLSELDLTELEHSKTVAEVISTFDDSKPYKYILADYNGKATYSSGIINIDYLIPSVRASWLLEAIETFSGFTLNGSFKTSPDFLNLYLTYPKGTPTSLEVTEIYNSVDGLTPGLGFTLTEGVGFVATENITITYQVQTIESGTYTATVNGVPRVGILELSIGDLVGSIFIDFAGSDPLPSGESGFVSVSKFDSIIIDFVEELKGMTIREFLNEIVWHFGLTLFKNKYENVYNLKTVAERTNQTEAIDWSDKFDQQLNERYIFGNYAQENYFRYKYNDQNASYNDGFFSINNENLQDFKTVIQSKTFSPELSFSNNLGFTTRVYKLWDKAPKDDGTTEYKALSNRFYFIKSVDRDFESLIIGSESASETDIVTSAPVETYRGLNFQEVVIKNYSEMQLLLDKSIIKNVSLYLTENDIVNLDLSLTYYFKQLGGSFILNKVNNFIPNKKTTCELVRINYTNQEIEFTPSNYSLDHYSSLHYST